MDLAVEVTELMPPIDEYPEMPDAGVEAYEAALDALQAGDWDEAFMLSFLCDQLTLLNRAQIL